MVNINNYLEGKINIIFLKFLDISASYIKELTKRILPLAHTFNWVKLRGMLFWSSGDAPVEKFVKFLIEQRCLDKKEMDQLFAEFKHVNAHLKNDPNIFNEWNENNTPMMDRWLSVFANLKQQSLPFNVFAKLVECVFVISGETQNNVNYNLKISYSFSSSLGSIL